jgi:hypothetical protein
MRMRIKQRALGSERRSLPVHSAVRVSCSHHWQGDTLSGRSGDWAPLSRRCRGSCTLAVESFFLDVFSKDWTKWIPVAFYFQTFYTFISKFRKFMKQN